MHKKYFRTGPGAKRIPSHGVSAAIPGFMANICSDVCLARVLYGLLVFCHHPWPAYSKCQINNNFFPGSSILVRAVLK